MSRRYRRKNYDDDYLSIIGLVIIGIISYIIKFVIQNFVLIISIILVLSIIILLIINRERIINLYEKRYIKKLKSNSELFLNIEKINNKYNLCELKDFIDYYNVYNRSSLDKDLMKTRIYKDDYTKHFEAIRRYNIPHIAINTEKMNELEVASIVLNAIELWRIDDDNRKFVMDLFSIDNLQSSNNLTYQELSEKMFEKVKVKKLERRKKL